MGLRQRRFRASRVFLPYHFGLFAAVFVLLSGSSLLGALGMVIPGVDRGVIGGCVSGLGGLTFLALSLALAGIAALEVRAAMLSYRFQGWRFCRGMAWVACLFFPFGTILGLWIVYWLGRNEVRAMFEDQRSLPPGVTVS